MNLLLNTTSAEELKREYRRLARVCHPDTGGSDALMQELNLEYQKMKKQLHAPSHNQKKISVGDIVRVNGTLCQVTYVSIYTFIALSLDHRRSAVFDKTTGFAVGNRKYRARFC